MITLEQVKTLLNGITIRMPVPDWNEQNDKSPNFIRNRPFYKNSSGVKKISKEFLPSVGADEVAFDQEMSELLAGAKNVQEGFRKIAEDNYFEIKPLIFKQGSTDFPVEVIGSDGNIFIGRIRSRLMISQDGANWQYPGGVQKFLKDNEHIAYVKGAYYLYQKETTSFWRSLDLIHWEQISLSADQSILSPPYEAHGRLYMGTKSDKVNILVSDDGINWLIYYQTVFEDHPPRETIGFACDDEVAVFSFYSGLKACYFDDFDNWIDSGIEYYVDSCYQLGVVNGVFYRYEYGGFVFLKDKTNLNSWEQYVAPGDHLIGAYGPAAYKDGYYLFNSTGDFSDDALVYTKDFNTFQTYTEKRYYAQGGVYATKKAVAVAGLAIVGPRNELGIVKEKKLEQTFEEYTRNVLTPELQRFEETINEEKLYELLEEIELTEDVAQIQRTYENLDGLYVEINKSSKIDSFKFQGTLIAGDFSQSGSTLTFTNANEAATGFIRLDKGLLQWQLFNSTSISYSIPVQKNSIFGFAFRGVETNLPAGLKFSVYGLKK